MGSEIVGVHVPSKTEMAFFFVSGMIVSVPMTLFSGPFTNGLCFVLPLFYAQVCSTGLVTPLVEEFAKAYPLFYRHGESGRSLYTMGFLTGLSFGVVEFIIYVLQFRAAIPFRVVAVVFHASTASLTAYGIWREQPFRYYILAVARHTANNFSSFFGNWWYVGGLGGFAVAAFLSWTRYQEVQSVQMPD
ncbi:MAG TPA: hypothetical protein VM050_00685 [Patescibacteria group bacterium]|nr:hypothetical protein [Patescibacteria group bacterium]